MHKLYELKDMLCEELEQYASKDKLDAGGLSVIDTLAHAVKNIDKIIESGESDEYSNRYDDGSYARGRRYPKRDSMGRYSSRRYDGYSRASDELVEQLRDMMKDAPDDHTRKEFERFIQKIEMM